MLHNQTSTDVAMHLRNLTNASRLERTGDHPALRRLGERAYDHNYVWLEEHQIQFVYDRVQKCYVEVVEDD